MIIKQYKVILTSFLLLGMVITSCSEDASKSDLDTDIVGDMTSDSGSDSDREGDSSSPVADTEVDTPEDMNPVVQISVGLENLASCDDLCGAQGLVCTQVKNFLNVMVAGTADYESDITSYSPDCAGLPDVDASNADGQLVPLVTYTCNCTNEV